MSIAFDAASSFGHSTLHLEWTHTPIGTPRGVIVQVVETLNVGADNVTSVTYGGVTMTRITGATVIQASGFDMGAVYTYFLGSNIPTGPQTVYVTVASGSSKVGIAYTVTADADTAVDCVATLDSTGVTDPSVTLTALHECFVVGALHSGQNDVADVSVGANYTEVYEDDFSISIGSFVRKTTLGSVGNIIVNWTMPSEQAAIAAIGINELGTNSNLTLFISGPNDTTNNTITFFESGLDVKNNNLSLFEAGSSTSSSNFTLFEAGKEQQTNNLTLFEQGFSPLSSGLSLYIYGADSQSSSLPLFLQGYNTSSGNLTLFIEGGNISSAYNSLDLFLQSFNTTVSGLPLYISGPSGFTTLTPPPNDLTLFIHGLSNTASGLPLYIYSNTFDSLPLFIEGKVSDNNSLPLFTFNSIPQNSGLPLYIYGAEEFTSLTPPPNDLTLFIAGPLQPTNSLPLYISGPYAVRICGFTRYINRDIEVDLEL